MGRMRALRWMVVPSLEGIEEFVVDPATEKSRIGRFWSANPNLIGETEAAPGTPAFFDEVDAARKATHWPLYELVPFAQTKGRRVLEVGCGLGSDGAEFARSGADYIGIDLTEPAVCLTKRKLEAYGLPGSTIRTDAESLPFRDESFDLVYSWGVIHHTPDTQRCVDEIHRVLRPGGRVILMLYHQHGWWSYRIRLHWVLLSLLRFPPVAVLARTLLGARRDQIDRWNALYRIDRHALFSKLLARETDGAPHGVNPHSKVYSKGDARRLLAGFEHVRTRAAHWLDLPSLGHLLGHRRYRQLMRSIGAVNGSCLYIFARK